VHNERVAFLSEGKIYALHGEKAVAYASSAAENYIRNIKELNAKNDWKQRGHGAQFMGMHLPAEKHDLVQPHVTGLAAMANGTLAYTLNTGDMAGIYLKNLDAPDEKDSYVLAKRETALFQLDVHNGRFATTTADSTIGRHVAIVSADGGDILSCTEGDCNDSNPMWSRAEDGVLLYDSCGMSIGTHVPPVIFGPKSVYRLHVRSGELDEVLEGGAHEYLHPYEAEDGTLYCIRRPYRQTKGGGMSLLDVLLLPVRLLKGLFGFLNFFTQRYAGESLKTNGGPNPSKAQQKSEKELFIEGNLLDAEKNMKANAARGEKCAGYAPSSWELVAKRADGALEVLRKGVLDFRMAADGRIVFSNGKYILCMDGADKGNETLVGAAHLGVMPTILAPQTDA